MSFEATWHVPDRVILASFAGRATLEESKQVTPTLVKMMENSPYSQVHVLLDDGKMEGIPASLQQMREVAGFLGSPQTGWVLGVAPVSVAVHFMGAFLVQLFKVRYKRFHTIAEAEAFLAQVEPDLAELFPK